MRQREFRGYCVGFLRIRYESELFQLQGWNFTKFVLNNPAKTLVVCCQKKYLSGRHTPHPCRPYYSVFATDEFTKLTEKKESHSRLFNMILFFSNCGERSKVDHKL
jgi:hypothetical protein